VGGGKERVEREFDGEYVVGRTREGLWTLNLSAIYDRSGTPRFWGQGNNTRPSAETNYTETQGYIQAQLGWNLTHYLQLALMSRPRVVDVTKGTLTGLVPITRRYAGLLGLGTNDEFLNRLLLTFDTRNDLTVPTRGAEVVIYGGMSSRRAIFNDSLYSEAGIDARDFVPLTTSTVLALHSALRYLPSYHKLPFWAYSFIGGDQSIIGGDQPLRGYGQGRWSDPNSFSSSAEVRQIVGSINPSSTHIDIELAPFVDLGRVFLRPSTNALTHLHDAYGLGFRGIARPFIVGYVDAGYGSEGVAAFTGINYEF
jgi:outer membrane protein assembly factor BamA